MLTYALGAATSLAAGALLGGRVLAAVRQAVRWGADVRRLLGVAVVAAAVTIWLGLDTGLLHDPLVRRRHLLTLWNEDLIAMCCATSPLPAIGMAAYAAEPACALLQVRCARC